MEMKQIKIYDPQTGETVVGKVTEEILDQMRLDLDYENLKQDKKRLELEEKQITRDLDEVNDSKTMKRDMEASIRKMECETARRNVEQVVDILRHLKNEDIYKENKDVIKKILKTNLQVLVN